MSRLLFDRNIPLGLKRHLVGHEVRTTDDEGWSTLKNGELLAAAERAGFAVFLTADNNLVHQQNLSGRRLGIVVLSHPAWSIVRQHLAEVIAATNQAGPGSYCRIAFPSPLLRRRVWRPDGT